MFGIVFGIGIAYIVVMLLYTGILYENSLYVPVEPQTKLEYRVIIIKEKIKWLQLNTLGLKPPEVSYSLSYR